MSELPWSKFFWSDWEADQGLRLCSLAAQGLWMRMLCVCAKGDPRGYLAINGKPLDSTGVARLCGITAEEAEVLMEELSLNGVFSRDRRGWIYSRRMVRDVKRSATGKKFANKRWSQTGEDKGEKPPPNGAPNGGAITQKPEARDPEARVESLPSSDSLQARRRSTREIDPEISDEDLVGEVMHAIGVDRPPIPTYWADPSVVVFIANWRSHLDLSPTEIVSAASQSRQNHDTPPDGPMGLNKVMKRWSDAKRNGEALSVDPGSRSRSRDQPDRDRSYLDEPLFPRTAGGKP